MVEIDHRTGQATCLAHSPCTSHCVPRMGFELVRMEQAVRAHPSRYADIVAHQIGRPIRRAANVLLDGAGSDYFEGAGR